MGASVSLRLSSSTQNGIEPLILGLIFFYILYLANKEQSKINQELHEQAIKNCNENLRHGYLGDPSDPASGVICRKIESEYFQKYGRAP